VRCPPKAKITRLNRVGRATSWGPTDRRPRTGDRLGFEAAGTIDPLECKTLREDGIRVAIPRRSDRRLARCVYSKCDQIKYMIGISKSSSPGQSCNFSFKISGGTTRDFVLFNVVLCYGVLSGRAPTHAPLEQTAQQRMSLSVQRRSGAPLLWSR
jgi:hypothetical protein